MSRPGSFDPSLLPLSWFDRTALAEGWFDSDLIGAAPATGKSSSGALVGQASAASGSAQRFRAFGTSGALAAAGASVAGGADRQAGTLTHAAPGALVGAGATASGAAVRFKAFGAAGDLVGPAANIIGQAARTQNVVFHTALGNIAGGSAVLVASAAKLVPADHFDYTLALHERLHPSPQLARMGAHLQMLRRARLSRR